MEKFKLIKAKEAQVMSKRKLEVEIGKHAKHLREECGMDRMEAATFISNLLNLGAAMDKILKDSKNRN